MYLKINGLNWLGLSLLLMTGVSTLGMEQGETAQEKLSQGATLNNKDMIVAALNAGACPDKIPAGARKNVLVYAAETSNPESEVSSYRGSTSPQTA
jgi:hypothetical protein